MEPAAPVEPEPGPPTRTGRQWVIPALVAGVTFVAGMVAVRPWIDDDPCDALRSEVDGNPTFTWSNGITGSGGEWISVLTDGIVEVRDEDRLELAEAVAADPDGYERFRGALDADDAEVADRLHLVVLDPITAPERAEEPVVQDDASALWRAVGPRCDLA